MGQLSAHFHHLARIEAATAICRRELLEREGLEADRDTVKRLAKAIVHEIEGLTETVTDERMAGAGESFLDEIATAFMDAIDKRDDRNSPTSKAIYHAEVEGRL